MKPAVPFPPRVSRAASGLFFVLVLSSCRGPGGGDESGLRGQLKQARAQLAEYHERFGPLPSSKPLQNLRTLQKDLPGKSLKEVAALLGKPGGVYLAGRRECWDYHGICQAPVTGRTVEKLSIWFQDGRVIRLDAVF